MKKENKIIRKLDIESIRRMCIDNQYYTNGTNGEYIALFDYIIEKENISDDDLIYIANDIKEHSITSDDLSYILTQINKRIVILESEEI